ncbi:MAG: HAD family hydrolase [bacterium]|nr:HAD family hydrolase [bacterium]
MSCKYIFFDLDGTLTDPQEGITNCVRYALEAFGIHEEDYDRLMRFIGPPLVDSFSQYYGFDKEKSLAAVEKYRERFSDVGLFENRVYDGICGLLTRLSEAGHVLVIATSKPRVYALRILAKYGLDGYFSFVAGSELDGTRNYKDEVISYAMENIGCAADEVIMVGDRRQDIIGAKKCGVTSCGVRFGYAEPGELEAAGADYIADDIEELENILLKV